MHRWREALPPQSGKNDAKQCLRCRTVAKQMLFYHLLIACFPPKGWILSEVRWRACRLQTRAIKPDADRLIKASTLKLSIRKDHMKLLLTAFDPFGGETINPAQEILARIGDTVGDTAIIKLVLPTVYGVSGSKLLEAVAAYQPDAVLCLGQAGGRAALTPERVAINIDDADMPDNAGQQPEDRPIVPGGPAAYFATLPIKDMVEAMLDAGIPAQVSNTAGTFVCNHVLYRLLHALAQGFPHVRGGFLHVPYTPQQAAVHGEGVPCIPLEDMVRGIKAAIGAI